MATPYLSQQPVDDFGLRFSDIKFSADLAASNNTPLSIPGQAPRYKALIKTISTASVWVSINENPEIPSNAFFTQTTSELVSSIGICREVKAGDVLRFISSDANTKVSVVLYALLTNN